MLNIQLKNMNNSESKSLFIKKIILKFLYDAIIIPVLYEIMYIKKKELRHTHSSLIHIECYFIAETSVQSASANNCRDAIRNNLIDKFK